MLDIRIRCACSCPATVSLNGVAACGPCAHRAIDRASPPRIDRASPPRIDYSAVSPRLLARVAPDIARRLAAGEINRDGSEVVPSTAHAF